MEKTLLGRVPVKTQAPPSWAARSTTADRGPHLGGLDDGGDARLPASQDGQVGRDPLHHSFRP